MGIYGAGRDRGSSRIRCVFDNKGIGMMLLVMSSFGLFGSPATRTIIISEARPVGSSGTSTIVNLNTSSSSKKRVDDIFDDINPKENELNYNFHTPETESDKKPAEPATNSTNLGNKTHQRYPGDGGLLPKGSYVDSGFTLRFPPITSEMRHFPVQRFYNSIPDTSKIGPLSILDEYSNSFLD